jgi:DNA polymerase-4
MDRQIVCFAVPALEISLARLTDPGLRHRAIGIAALNQPRAWLHTVSPEAHQEGVHVGMPIRHAIRLCPALQIVSFNPSRVHEAHRMLCKVVRRYTPIWEPVQAGSFFVDLTGTGRLFGLARDTASRIQRDVSRHHRLDGVVGIGSNKLVARSAAALVQPAQLYEVRPGSEQAFMASLSLETCSLLNRPQMKPIRERLQDLNLRTFGDLTDIPFPALEAAIGKWARPLSQCAQGVDSSPVSPPATQPCLELSRVLKPDQIDTGLLDSALTDLIEQLCRLLRRRHRICHGLALTIRLSDQTDFRQQQPIKPGSCWEHDLMPHVRALLQRCMYRRIRIHTLTLTAIRVLPPTEQCVLFEDPADTTHQIRQRLSLALDRLRERYGDHVIRYGRCGEPSDSKGIFSTPGWSSMKRRGRR